MVDFARTTERRTVDMSQSLQFEIVNMIDVDVIG